MKTLAILLLLLLPVLHAAESQEDIYYNWQDGLALTQDQLTAIKKILTDYRKQYSAIQEDYARLAGINRNLFEANQYDAHYYFNASLRVEEKRLAVERSFFEQMHALLTPEQRKKFANTIQEWNIQR